MKRDLASLIAFIDSRQNVPHRWGRDHNDCMSFVAGAVKAQTGVDPARGLRWAGEVSGLRLLQNLGGVEAILDARFRRIPAAQARRGDIAGVADDALGISPAIVEGLTLVAPGPMGNCRLKRQAATVAWSIDRER